ncbi:hypothetical protein Kpol_1027p12 [Vanderwaltozyma polyspora DSM 70294]|uniref:Peptide hydrolase n=1 Tax=Vanderwaltozyma polyspora (strain ATCC 22028 / DSM 70294 / BCRC 21397 / CBS 2163 / NBRC 10782 / NRRL Y-8283 / UCD 57-17) TaxID=436907 RepID=A7TQL7_VANPO|nr:uncharacterized protein Kpol_1027p12 [Vanderwaltozyma polyspora DSM 70294]EDO15438.1 hypothetical protein Kpol_1027p12 [Vanderwaltozyma polyspora DSM 70294]
MKVLVSLGLAVGLANAIVVPEFIQQVFRLEDDYLSSQLEELTTAASESNEPSFKNWLPHLPYFFKPTVDSQKLQDAITVEELNATAWDLYRIAESSNKTFGHPTRVIGSKGHRKTIKFLLDAFDEMKDYYEVSLQSFKTAMGKVNSFELVDPSTGEVFQNVTAFDLTPPVDKFEGRVIPILNMGCEKSDFELTFESMEDDHQYAKDGKKHMKKSKKKCKGHKGHKSGKSGKSGKGEKRIALVQRGICPFSVKSQLAGKFGFDAVIIYDNEKKTSGGLRGTLGTPNKNSIATVGVTNEVGRTILDSVQNNPKYSLSLYVDAYVKNIKVNNVIADTIHGDPENIVGLGAHSDSVEEGPGINDDGSGLISLLTVAKHLSHYKVNNKVRFAWWAAEEEGLVGSNYYANSLSPAENQKLRVFMDYDMMASPNYEYEVYDSNNKDHPKGSEELKNLYIDYYKSRGLNYTLIPFDGRSDYVGFIENGIPAGGIAAGAEKDNVFNGGVLDKCYHLLCDDVSNLSMEAFMVNTQLIAHSVATYAKSFEGFPERQTNATLNNVANESLLMKYNEHWMNM